MKKVLIFDFDGVFYSGEHIFDNVGNHVNKNRRKFLPNVSDKMYREICKTFPEWEKYTSGAEIIDCLYKIKSHYPELEISSDAFWNWQQEDIYTLIIDWSQVVDFKYMKELCKKFPVYIVSNSSPNHVEFYMKKLNVNPKWFKQIFSNRFEEFDQTKKHYYKQILEIEKCEPQNAYVYGDSIKCDLEPAKELNINNFHITNANDIHKIVSKSLKETDFEK